MTISLPVDRMAAFLMRWPSFEELPRQERQKATRLVLRLISEERGDVIGKPEDLEYAVAWAEIHAQTLVERLVDGNDGTDLLIALRNELSARRRRSNGRRHRYVEMADCRALAEQVHRSQELKVVPVSDEQIRLATGSEYRSAIRELARHAKQRFWLSSFYFHHWSGAPRSVRELVDEISRHSRKIDVRILLEGRSTQRAPTAKVNREAIELLGATSAKVRLHKQEMGRMHAKMIISDDHRGLLGSHNMTGGSLYRYGDVSVLIDSPEIVARLAAYFEELWREAVEP